jgi:hypothetical protein
LRAIRARAVPSLTFPTKNKLNTQPKLRAPFIFITLTRPVNCCPAELLSRETWRSRRVPFQYGSSSSVFTLDDLSIEEEFERRTFERTWRGRDALIRIDGLRDIFSCSLRDIAERGAGIRLHRQIVLLPIEFELSEDNFRTVRRCRLVWRQTDFAGVAFVDRSQQTAVRQD